MQTIKWNMTDEKLEAFGATMRVWCRVRNELNGLRKVNQVVYTMPGGSPYYPRTFPVGTWKVGRPVKKTDPYMAPWFIPTDAWQVVDVWKTDGSRYLCPAGVQEKDEAYGLHFSVSNTTLGCGRIFREKDADWLAQKIIEAIDAGELVEIEVT